MEKIVKAVLGNRKKTIDPEYEAGFSADIKKRLSPAEIKRLYSGFANDESEFAKIMRRILLKTLCKSFGNGVVISTNVIFVHPETMRIGDNVFFGQYSFIQGRFDGRCSIGEYTWVGPHSFLDARDLTIGKYAGIGPGVKIIGSEHSARPIGVPIVKTDLIIKTVTIKDESDIGAGTVILPGVTVGSGCIIGANAVVNRNIPDYSVAVGVPAKVIKNRRIKNA